MDNKEILTEKWYSPKAIAYNFKAICWMSMNSKNGKPGFKNEYGKTVLFITISGLILMGIDAAVSLPFRL